MLGAVECVSFIATIEFMIKSKLVELLLTRCVLARTTRLCGCW